jgi:hypothetical protein
LKGSGRDEIEVLSRNFPPPRVLGLRKIIGYPSKNTRCPQPRFEPNTSLLRCRFTSLRGAVCCTPEPSGPPAEQVAVGVSVYRPLAVFENIPDRPFGLSSPRNLIWKRAFFPLITRFKGISRPNDKRHSIHVECIPF